MFKVTKFKTLDTLKVRYKGKEYDIAVLVVIENGELKRYKILGICEFPGNPLSSRKPKTKEEEEVLTKLEKKIEELREKISHYFGRVLEI